MSYRSREEQKAEFIIKASERILDAFKEREVDPYVVVTSITVALGKFILRKQMDVDHVAECLKRCVDSYKDGMDKYGL